MEKQRQTLSLCMHSCNYALFVFFIFFLSVVECPPVLFVFVVCFLSLVVECPLVYCVCSHVMSFYLSLVVECPLVFFLSLIAMVM